MNSENCIKLFEGKSVRTSWDNKLEKWYFSVVDIVSILTNSDYQNARNYWKILKFRLKKEGNESVTNCNQLKMKSTDGKYYKTDVADTEQILRLIQSIPSKKAEPFKLWLAKVGRERIDETFDPTLSVQRAIDLYRLKGYDEDWISKRIKVLQERKKLTDIWKENGIESNLEYALLTNEIYKEWSGMTAKEYKEFKGLRKENLRDNMTDLEVLLTDIGEVTTKELAKKHKPQGFEQNKQVAKIGGEIAKSTRNNIEEKLGDTIISKENSLNYKYLEGSKILKENKNK